MTLLEGKGRIMVTVWTAVNRTQGREKEGNGRRERDGKV